MREVSVSAPARIDLDLQGGTGRAGRIYVLLASMSGTWPGWPLAGETLHLNRDWLTTASLQSANGALFQQNLGLLDASGGAAAAIDLPSLGVLPAALIGVRISLAGWVFAAPGPLNGEPTNAVDLMIGG